MSPTLLLFKNMRLDAGNWHVPVRFGVLIRYGEGPHITALCLLPIALAFTWWALDAKRPRALALAAIFCAAVVSNNFYGATALAMFFPSPAVEFLRHPMEARVALSCGSDPLLAYGLTAFWLSPSYLRITLHNMQYVSEKGSSWSIAVAVATVCDLRGSELQACEESPGAHLGAIYRRGAGLLRSQRGWQSLPEFPGDRRARTADSGTGLGHHSVARVALRMDVAAPRAMLKTAVAIVVILGVRQHPPLREEWPPHHSEMAGLPIARGVIA